MAIKDEFQLRNFKLNYCQPTNFAVSQVGIMLISAFILPLKFFGLFVKWVKESTRTKSC